MSPVYKLLGLSMSCITVVPGPTVVNPENVPKLVGEELSMYSYPLVLFGFISHITSAKSVLSPLMTGTFENVSAKEKNCSLFALNAYGDNKAIVQVNYQKLIHLKGTTIPLFYLTVLFVSNCSSRTQCN